jgi:hypothetical protein
MINYIKKDMKVLIPFHSIDLILFVFQDSGLWAVHREILWLEIYAKGKLRRSFMAIMYVFVF